MDDNTPPRQPLALGLVRFAMEIVAFGGLFWWGWTIGDGGFTGVLLGILFFLVAASLWGIFAVPGDPSRNPDPPVGIPGWLRLLIELGIFGTAACGIWLSGSRALAETLLTAVVLTYVLTYDRSRWLLRQRSFSGPRKARPTRNRAARSA
jgi:hypothetical protein